MAYNKTTWVDNSAPAVDAAHLNNIENGIEALDIALGSTQTSISNIISDIETNTTNIANNTASISNINTKLTNLVIVRQGTFTGSWNPTLASTFAISNYTDYNWTISVYQKQPSIPNNGVITLNGYVEADGNTLNFDSLIDALPTPAYYVMTGIKKIVSNLATVNQ